MLNLVRIAYQLFNIFQRMWHTFKAYNLCTQQRCKPLFEYVQPEIIHFIVRDNITERQTSDLSSSHDVHVLTESCKKMILQITYLYKSFCYININTTVKHIMNFYLNVNKDDAITLRLG